MGIYTPRVPVGTPPFAPSRFGLSSVWTPATDAGDDDGARSGVVIEPDACGEAAVYVDTCDGPRPAKDHPADVPLRAADPFVVYASDECSPVGRTFAEARARAQRFLANGEGRAVEREFWTGENGTMPHLAEDTETLTPKGWVLQPAATVVDGTGLSPVEALRRIESALADCYGGEGVLHMPRGDAAALIAKGGGKQDGERLVTHVGTRIAAGAGYPGTGPDGTDPGAGASWWYATGAVVMRRSEVDPVGGNDGETVNRTTNDRWVIAERTYSLTWDCCLLAVLVDWTGALDGGGA